MGEKRQRREGWGVRERGEWMASWQMRRMKTEADRQREQNKTKQKKKSQAISPFLLLHRLKEWSNDEQAWRERQKKKTRERWQRWGGQSERRKKKQKTKLNPEKKKKTEQKNSSIFRCDVCVWVPPSGRPSEPPALTCQPESEHSCPGETQKKKGKKQVNKSTRY